MTQPQIRQSTPFSIERKEGKTPSTLIFRLSGPFTARDMYGSLTPQALREMFNFQSMPNEKPPLVNIVDLTDVPYMDSSGLGVLVTHYVHCQNIGVKLIIAGMTPRVMELFRMTRMDTTLPLSNSVEEVDVP
jgi:anti-anti-sigma factor